MPESYPFDTYNLIGGEWTHEGGKVKFEVYDSKVTQFAYKAKVIPEDGVIYTYGVTASISLDNNSVTIGYRRNNDFGSRNVFKMKWNDPNEIFLDRMPEIDYTKPDWENQRGSVNPTMPGGIYRRK